MPTPTHPILFVHGIWDDASTFDAMRRHLDAAGCPDTLAISMTPNNGSAPIPDLAEQVSEAARELVGRSGSERVDVVGFSMGALVTRYWIQRLDGKTHARRFISISGPHHGTQTARFLFKPGVKQMRPRSELVRSLAEDPDPFSPVEVTVFYTPFDLMIVPAASSRLPHAKAERRFKLPLHRNMITHRTVFAAIEEVLS